MGVTKNNQVFCADHGVTESQSLHSATMWILLKKRNISQTAFDAHVKKLAVDMDDITWIEQPYSSTFTLQGVGSESYNVSGIVKYQSLIFQATLARHVIGVIEDPNGNCFLDWPKISEGK